MNKISSKFIWLCAVGLLSALSVEAQSSDSLTVVSAQWQSKKLARGVSLKQQQFLKGENPIFESNQFISILEISPKAKGVKLDVAAHNGLEFTSKMAERGEAIAAVNGTFFNVKPPYQSVDYIMVDGEEFAPNDSGSDGRRVSTQNGTIVIRGTKSEIVKPQEPLSWESTLQAEDVMSSGPLMILDGESLVIRDESHFYGRHPRTVIAKRADGGVLLITIDGRAELSQGLTILEVQSLVRWLGAEDALNLDGGGSTTMWTHDQGVVNHPSDNKKFDAEGERRVANAILITKTR